MSAVEQQLILLLYLFAIASVVTLVGARYQRVQYTTGLLVAGLLVSVVGSPIAVELTSEFILLALLPALIFNDAINADVTALRQNLGPILVLAVVGLLVSIAIVGLVGQVVFGFPLAVALLFGAIIVPTDPVSVVAVFEDLGVPERLNVLVEGESLLNDGVAIVVYSTVLGIVVEAESRAVPISDVVTPAAFLLDVGVGIVVALVGGALVGAVVGRLASDLVARVDDGLAAVVVSFLVAYGVYVFLDLLGSSGVIGTLTAGVFLASREGRSDVSPATHFAVETVWGYAAFVANTIIFVAIGIITPFDLLVAYAPGIVAAIVIVFLARAVVVYPLVGLLNRWVTPSIPRSYQHVLTWSGIHASVSIALVLGVEELFSGALADELSALVFGVAAVTLLVNGSTMGALIERLDISRTGPHQRLYEALVGQLHGVDAAIDTAEELHERDELSTSVVEDITAAYRRERAELRAAIESLLDSHPDIRHHERRLGQHRILVAQHQAIREAIQRGEIGTEVGERLLQDVEGELDRVPTGEWAAEGTRPSDARSYWREQLREVGLDGEDGTSGADASEADDDAGSGRG